MPISGTFSIFFSHSPESLSPSIFCSLTCSLCKNWNKILIFHLNPGSHEAARFILLSLPSEVERAASTSTSSYLLSSSFKLELTAWGRCFEFAIKCNIFSLTWVISRAASENLKGIGRGGDRYRNRKLVDWISTAFKLFSQRKIPSFSGAYPLYFLSTSVKLCLDLHMHRSLDRELIFQTTLNPARMAPCNIGWHLRWCIKTRQILSSSSWHNVSCLLASLVPQTWAGGISANSRYRESKSSRFSSLHIIKNN